jgi:hypothetical protein
MGPPAFAPALGRRRTLAALLSLGAVLACDGPTDPGEGIKSISIVVPTTVLRPGLTLNAVAEARDVNGILVNRQVTWRSLDVATLSVDQRSGLVLAKAPGIGRLRASIGSAHGELQFTLVNPPAATLTNSADTLRLLLPAGRDLLKTVARDAEGLALIGAPVQWESSASRIASVNANGDVNAASAGEARLISHVDAIADTTVVIVSAPSSPNAPVIGTTDPAIAIPGQALVVNGERFAPQLAGNQVMLDGTPVPVIAASPTQLTLDLPQATQFACAPTGPVALQVTTSGGIGVGTVTLQMAPQRALLKGQSIVVPGGLEARCLELSPADGRYLLSVHNTSRVLGTAGLGFSVYATATPVVAPLMAELQAADRPPATRVVYRPSAGGARPGTPSRAAQSRRVRAHAQLLSANRDAALHASAAGARRMANARNSPSIVDPVLGALRPVRVPNLEVVPRNCNSYNEIGTRIAFVGPHLAILEDTMPFLSDSPTLRGQLDGIYAQLGAEFEAITWPTLQAFGNALVKDDRLDDNGRVIVVFTPRMNVMLDGSLLAATTSCDMFPRQLFEQSNVGEYIYAQVPVTLDPGTGPGTTERWLWSIRTTLAHELKHVVSYAERTNLDRVPEEEWLEEATARHAEELFARQLYGTVIRGNHGFDATLDCEANFGTAAPPECAGQPRAMLPHFEGLWDFLDATTTRSPLGATSAGDFSHYGAAWSLTRWALDHSGLTEATFFQAVTLSVPTGIANLQSRFGRSWEDMIGEWSLTMAIDDTPGLDPEVPRLTFPSWKLPEIFQGLCNELGPCIDPSQQPSHYPRAQPLRTTVAKVGDFTIEYPWVRAGGFGIVELGGGDASTRLLLALRGYRGQPLPTEAKFSIVRIE